MPEPATDTAPTRRGDNTPECRRFPPCPAPVDASALAVPSARLPPMDAPTLLCRLRGLPDGDRGAREEEVRADGRWEGAEGCEGEDVQLPPSRSSSTLPRAVFRSG